MPEVITPTNPFDLDFSPLSKTYQEGVDQQGYFARQAYYGPWDDARAFMLQMLGQSYNQSGWLRQVPYILPGNLNLVAREGLITNMDGVVIDLEDLSIAKDDVAMVTITFRTPNIIFQRGQNEDDQSLGVTEAELNALLWAEQEIDSFVEVITLPGTNVVWWESDKPVASPIAMAIIIQTMDIFYHQYPQMPATLIRPYLGRLNSTTFLGNARGTVMCKRSKTRRVVDSTGRMAQQFGISFHQREYDWNMEPVIAKKMNGDDFAYTGRWDYIALEATLLDPSVDSPTNNAGPWRYKYENFQNLLEFQLP